MGRGVSYATHGRRSLFGPNGIIRTPDAILTNIESALFCNAYESNHFKPLLRDMTVEVAAQQPSSDPTVDAMRLFNLFYLLSELFALWKKEGSI
jgi:hypothetical protein